MNWDRPLPLLLFVGLFLGANFPLGKMALAQGVDPALWAAYICLGAGFTLFLITTAIDNPQPRQDAPLRYAFTSGFLSFVMPNLLTYLVIPHIGSGLASVMFALSPPATALMSWVFGVRPPNAGGLLGIAVGLVGAVLIIMGRENAVASQGSLWIGAALMIPLFLALGNVYRTKAWPKNATPRRLASYTNLAAVPFLLVAAAALRGSIDLKPFSAIPGLMALQLCASTAMFMLFFRLQQIGGPTYLSQIGYVAAAVGLVAGVMFLHETYPTLVWLGAAVIAAGIAVTTYANRNAR
jgi:drug/metabolite transporter (DMT)-like permease